MEMFKRFIQLRTLWIISAAVFILLIIIGSNYELLIKLKSTPLGTQYFGATGYYFDYYQYLTYMKDGADGNLLIRPRYVPNEGIPVLIHPFFTVAGYIGQLFRIPSFILYHMAKNLFLAGWLGILWIFAKTFIRQTSFRRLAYIFLLGATGIPLIRLGETGLLVSPVIDFWPNFYTIEKFTLPPHHLFSYILLLGLLMVVIRTVEKKIRPVTGGTVLTIGSFLLISLNPSIWALYVVLVFSSCILHGISMSIRKTNTGVKHLFESILPIFFSMACSLPLFLYQYNVFQIGDPWKYYYFGEKTGRYFVSFWQYLVSLGPLVLTAIISIVMIRKFSLKEWILLVWLVFGLLLFPFVGREIPISMSRLFSYQLYIPAVILTVIGLENVRITSAIGKIIYRVGGMIVVGCLISGLYCSINTIFSYRIQNLYNVFLPESLTNTIAYINQHQRPNTSIIAGENISNLLPAFTSTRVVWGREDVYGGAYTGVGRDVTDVFFRRIDDTAIFRKFKTWNVQYLLFGLDEIPYETFSQKGTMPSLRVVYQNGPITLVEVISL